MVGDRKWWVIRESNSAGVLLQSRPLPEPHPNSASGVDPARVPSPSELAVRTGIEPVSLHGQWSCLTRCIADLADPRQRRRSVVRRRPLHPRALRGGGVIRIGAPGPARTGTACALNAFPLPIGVQTHGKQLQNPGCNIGWRTRLDSNQRGADARPLKRRLPSIAWLLVRNSVGYLRDHRISCCRVRHLFCPGSGSAKSGTPDLGGAPQEVWNWRTRWDSHPR